MPGGDRTGPVGMGPMTGRGTGCCAGYSAPGIMNLTWERGGGRGWGRGGGGGGGGGRHRHWYQATGMPGWQRAWMAGPVVTKEQQLTALKNQAKYFEQALEDLRGRILEVESSAEGSKTT